ETTVSWLTSQEPPARLPENNRVPSVECNVWKVTARLIAYKSEEDDNDYHLVLQDLDSDATMIAEIPDSDCAAVCSSSKRGQFEKARETFSTAFGTPTPKLRRLTKVAIITVTGVGFFDR